MLQLYHEFGIPVNKRHTAGTHLFWRNICKWIWFPSQQLFQASSISDEMNSLGSAWWWSGMFWGLKLSDLAHWISANGTVERPPLYWHENSCLPWFSAAASLGDKHPSFFSGNSLCRLKVGYHCCLPTLNQNRHILWIWRLSPSFRKAPPIVRQGKGYHLVSPCLLHTLPVSAY